MSGIVAIVVRILVGVLSVIVSFLVLDAIHDRNTEIIVACLGLFYCFLFVISRRWQYYGLNAVSLFGMMVSWLDAEPHDHATRHALRLPRQRAFVAVSLAFAALVELLCGYRLLTSLIGHGWERLATLRTLIDIPLLQQWLGRL